MQCVAHFITLLHSGVWATKLGEMAGVKVPLIAMHHAYVVTERIEGIQVGTPAVTSQKGLSAAYEIRRGPTVLLCCEEQTA